MKIIMSRQSSQTYRLTFVLLALALLLIMLTACSASGTASDNPGGSISPPGTIKIPRHGSQTYTITPDPCYKVEDVTVNGVSVLDQCLANGRVLTYTVTDVTTDIVIIGYYARATHTITSSAGTGGGISPLGQATVDECDDLTFVINPFDCYDIADVKVDGISMGRLALFTFTNVTTDNHTIDASFAKARHTIKARALTSGGSIYASTPISSPDLTFKKGVYDVSVDACSDETFVIKPDDGYQISDLQIDGISVEKQGSYTFTNIHHDHTIAVSFSPKITHSITFKSSECCLIVPCSSDAVYYSGGSWSFNVIGVEDQEDMCFEIIPISGDVSPDDIWLQHSGSWTPSGEICEVWVDDMYVGPVTQYIFKNVTMDHTISAFSSY